MDQLDLIAPEDLPSATQALETRTAQGEYTGELLLRRHPELYRAAVSMLGAGMGIRQVARMTNLNARSVMSIRDREGGTIATLKESMAKNLLQLGELGAEACLETLLDNRELKPSERRDLMVSVGIAIDKGLLLAGEATWRGEMIHRNAPAHDDFNAILEAECEVVSTGPRDETAPQKGRADDPDHTSAPVAQLDRASDFGSLGAPSPIPTSPNVSSHSRIVPDSGVSNDVSFAGSPAGKEHDESNGVGLADETDGAKDRQDGAQGGRDVQKHEPADVQDHDPADDRGRGRRRDDCPDEG